MAYSKVIQDFENYLIYENGRVYSLYKNRYLKLRLNGHGRYQVILYNNEGHYSKKVSRLVAEAFIPNPKGKAEVNHKDLDKLNNDISNLEWVTHSENILHA
ncbi:hypothetical protein ES705_25411 [subsurface metagenome]